MYGKIYAHPLLLSKRAAAWTAAGVKTEISNIMPATFKSRGSSPTYNGILNRSLTANEVPLGEEDTVTIDVYDASIRKSQSNLLTQRNL